MANDTYPAVLDDEEELKRNPYAAAAIPLAPITPSTSSPMPMPAGSQTRTIPMDAAPMPQTVADPSGELSTPSVAAPAVMTREAGGLVKRGAAMAATPAGALPPVVPPKPIGPQPTWSGPGGYAPPERHGWSKFGSALASINPAMNEFVNIAPERRAEERYNTATKEYGERVTEQEKQAAATSEAALKAAQAKAYGERGLTQEEIQRLRNEGALDVAGAKGKTAEDIQVQKGKTAETVQGLKNTGAADLQNTRGGQAQDLEKLRQTGRVQLQQMKGEIDKLRIHEQGGKIPPLVGKSYDTYQDSQSRYDVMEQNLVTGKLGDQQAMLSLLANHLGMTMGLAKGARINQAMINEAEASAPWLGRIQSKFDDRGYLTGVTLTPEQMDSMVDLARNRVHEDGRKVQAMETYFNARGNRGEETPATEGGGKGAARTAPKAGAVESGYRFKGGNPADKANWEKQ